MTTGLAKGDLNKSTFVGTVLGPVTPFKTAVLKTPGCSFVLKVQEDENGPTNELPMVVHGKMAVSIYPKLVQGQRLLIQASARFKKTSVPPKAAEAPFFVVKEIVTI
jgi:hypothetical protein